MLKLSLLVAVRPVYMICGTVSSLSRSLQWSTLVPLDGQDYYFTNRQLLTGFLRNNGLCSSLVSFKDRLSNSEKFKLLKTVFKFTFLTDEIQKFVNERCVKTLREFLMKNKSWWPNGGRRCYQTNMPVIQVLSVLYLWDPTERNRTLADICHEKKSM